MPFGRLRSETRLRAQCERRVTFCDSLRLTGIWVYKNGAWCGYASAPGYPSQRSGGWQPANRGRWFGKLRRSSWIVTGARFYSPRAQWPGRNCTQALLILRAGNSAACGRSASPVKGGPGERRLGAPERCSSGAVPGGVLPNPSLLPAKPSEAGSPGRGGARERTQFSPPGGNGVEWTLRRRAAVGKVTRRPQAAKFPCEKSHPAAR